MARKSKTETANEFTPEELAALAAAPEVSLATACIDLDNLRDHGLSREFPWRLRIDAAHPDGKTFSATVIVDE